MSSSNETLKRHFSKTGNPDQSKQSSRLVRMAVEDVFHDWITRNMGLNHDNVVADLLNYGLIELIQDDNNYTVGFKKGRQLTEEQQFRVADGISKCLAHVLDESDAPTR